METLKICTGTTPRPSCRTFLATPSVATAWLPFNCVSFNRVTRWILHSVMDLIWCIYTIGRDGAKPRHFWRDEHQNWDADPKFPKPSEVNMGFDKADVEPFGGWQGPSCDEVWRSHSLVSSFSFGWISLKWAMSMAVLYRTKLWTHLPCPSRPWNQCLTCQDQDIPAVSGFLSGYDPVGY